MGKNELLCLDCSQNIRLQYKDLNNANFEFFMDLLASFQTEVETDSEVEDDPYETRSKCEY